MPFVDDFKTLRIAAGLRMAKVASEAGLSVDTIQRIERHHTVRIESCVAAVEDSLNQLFYNKKGQPLVAAHVVTEYSRFGGNFTPAPDQPPAPVNT